MNEPLEVKISEKYYMEQGRGIEQLLAVSLNESIELHEFESFIQLKGDIILEGEYACENHPYEPGEKLQYPQRKYIHTVEMLDNDIVYFKQSIPIDITIPRANILQVQDIHVDIHQFDYSIPTPHLIILFATIRVNGIMKVGKEGVEDNPRVGEGIPLSAEENQEQLQNSLPIDETEVNDLVADIHAIEVDERNTIVDKDGRKDNMNLDNQSEASLEDPVILDEANKEQAYEIEKEETDENKMEQGSKSFLMSLFDEEKTATVILYIVQDGESLKEIADRFDLTEAVLRRHNTSIMNDVTPGDVLSVYL